MCDLLLSSGRTLSLGQTSSSSIIFCECEGFYSTVLITSNFNSSYCCKLQLFLLLRTSTVLIMLNFNCSYCCELQLFLLGRTLTVLIAANFNCSYLHHCIMYRVYITLSTLDSALLCNYEIPLRILILWLWAA